MTAPPRDPVDELCRWIAQDDIHQQRGISSGLPRFERVVVDALLLLTVPAPSADQSASMSPAFASGPSQEGTGRSDADPAQPADLSMPNAWPGLAQPAEPPATDDLVERIRALADCSYWATAGWDIPGDATQKIGRLAVKAADLIERQAREIAGLREVIAWANNSLFGSHGFFLSTRGDLPNNPHHLDTAIEALKADARLKHQAEAERDALWECVAELVAAHDELETIRNCKIAATDAAGYALVDRLREQYDPQRRQRALDAARAKMKGEV